ncbi:MAG: 50S ribosomal protein L18 [Candidatus Bathyarchaeia archaeon]
MATGPRYRVPFRRRKEGRTNYRSRRALVLSRAPRVVVRLSLKNTIIQVTEAESIGDKVIISAHSRELMKTYGWLSNGGNIPAAYLTGLLCGYKAHAAGVETAFLDVGLHIPSKGTRVFAALKGFIDAGVEVPHGEGIFPNKDTLTGKQIANYAKKMFEEDIEAYKKKFSIYISKGLRPETLTEHFTAVKAKIVSSFKENVKEKEEA